MKEIIILTPEDVDKNSPSKVLDKDLNLIKAFAAGKRFYFESFQYDSLHTAMETVFTLDHSFIILGGLTDFGKLLEETGKAGYRRKKEHEGYEPTIKDRRSTEIVLDLDDHFLEGYDPLDPEPAIVNWLVEKGINCDVTWQITSSQKLNTNEARLRLYFESSKRLDLKTRKAWAQSPEINADGSVFTCSQPIYTAPPRIEDAEDPIPNRHGFIKGEVSYFDVPELSQREIEKYSSYDFTSPNTNAFSYGFASKEVPEEVIQGKVYRRYFMPYAFSLANRGLTRDEIFAIIQFKSQSCSPRPFVPDNVLQYIDDALSKIDNEQVEKVKYLATRDELLSHIDELPMWPASILNELPEPWPMIFRNYRRAVTGKFIEPILYATVISTNAHFLNSKYLTGFGKGKIPNTFNLILYPSGGGKDTNTTGVIRNLSSAFNSNPKTKFPNSDLFSVIRTSYKDNISSDTGFLNAIDRDTQSLFMLDTEATKTIKKINSQGNENVSNLGQKFIEAANGDIIRGKSLAGGKEKQIEDVMNPTIQILLAGQPETTAESLTADNIHSGLLARCNIFYAPPEDTIDADDFMLDSSSYDFKIDDDFYDFYSGGELQKLGVKRKDMMDGRQLRFLKEDEDILNKWILEKIVPIAKLHPELKSLLLRIIYIIEQQYAIVLGIMQQWDIHNKQEIRQSFDPMLLAPVAEYYMHMKLYLLRNVINKAIDPFSEAIMETVAFLITNPHKAQAHYRKMCDSGWIPVAAIKQLLSSRSKYQHLKDLMGAGDQRIIKTLDLLEETGELVCKKDDRNKKCYAIPSKNEVDQHAE